MLHVHFDSYRPGGKAVLWSHTAAGQGRGGDFVLGGPVSDTLGVLLLGVDVGCQLMVCHKWRGQERSPHRAAEVFRTVEPADH